jgi:hypothetical protein
VIVPVRKIPQGVTGTPQRSAHRKSKGKLTSPQIVLQCLPATFEEIKEVLISEGFQPASAYQVVWQLKKDFVIFESADGRLKLAKPPTHEFVARMRTAIGEELHSCGHDGVPRLLSKLSKVPGPGRTGDDHDHRGGSATGAGSFGTSWGC